MMARRILRVLDIKSRWILTTTFVVACIFSALIYFYTLEDRVSVRTVHLPEVLLPLLPSADVLTQNAVRRVPATINDLLDSAYKTPIFSSAGDSTKCSEVAILDVLDSFPQYERSLRKIRTDSELPPLNILKDTGSFGGVIRFLKRELGVDFVEIIPSVVVEQSHIFLIVDVHGPDRAFARTQRSISSVQNLENELSRDIALILFPYLSPAVGGLSFADFHSPPHVNEKLWHEMWPRVALLLGREFSSVIEAVDSQNDLTMELYVAEKIWRDPSRSVLIRAQQVNVLGDNFAITKSNTNKRRHLAVMLAKDILQYSNLDALGESREISEASLRAIITGGAILTNYPPSMSYRQRKDAASFIEKSHAYMMKAGPFRDLLLSDLFFTAGLYEKSSEHLKKAIDGFRRSNHLNYDSLSKIILMAGLRLIDMKKYDYANLSISLIRDIHDYKNTLDVRIQRFMEILEADILLAKGQVGPAIEVLQSEEVAKFPCVYFQGLLGFQERAGLGPKRSLGGSGLKEADQLSLTKAVRSAFEVLELSAPFGFHFFNSWGVFLEGLGEHQKAREKYGKARQYPGDHNWALLNEANSALRAKELLLAHRLYLRSLQNGAVWANVSGILNTSEVLGRSKDYVDNYMSYGAFLWDRESSEQIIYARLAVRHACALGRPLDAKLVHPLTDKDLKEFNQANCTWTRGKQPD